MEGRRRRRQKFIINRWQKEEESQFYSHGEDLLTWTGHSVDVSVLSLAVLIFHAFQGRHFVGFVVLLLGVSVGGRKEGKGVTSQGHA